MRGKGPDRDYLETLQREIDALKRRISNLENDSKPVDPIYDPADFPQDPVEGQHAVGTDNLFHIYSDGAWRIVGGASGIARMAWGAIYNDANIIEAGSGDWTVGQVGNVYTITFTTAFPSPPIATITPNNNNSASAGGGDVAYFAELSARAVGSIEVKTWRLDGTADDGGFDFIAIV